MTLYAFALFLHVVGVLLLFAAITAEGIGLFQFRRATTTAQVATWQGVTQLARVFGPASVVAILLPGLYTMATSWGWVPWIAVGLLAWAAIAVRVPSTAYGSAWLSPGRSAIPTGSAIFRPAHSRFPG